MMLLCLVLVTIINAYTVPKAATKVLGIMNIIWFGQTGSQKRAIYKKPSLLTGYFRNSLRSYQKCNFRSTTLPWDQCADLAQMWPVTSKAIRRMLGRAMKNAASWMIISLGQTMWTQTSRLRTHLLIKKNEHYLSKVLNRSRFAMIDRPDRLSLRSDPHCLVINPLICPTRDPLSCI